MKRRRCICRQFTVVTSSPEPVRLASISNPSNPRFLCSKSEILQCRSEVSHPLLITHYQRAGDETYETSIHRHATHTKIQRLFVISPWVRPFSTPLSASATWTLNLPIPITPPPASLLPNPSSLPVLPSSVDPHLEEDFAAVFRSSQEHFPINALVAHRAVCPRALPFQYILPASATIIKDAYMSKFLVRVLTLLSSPIVHSHRSGAHDEQ